MSEFLISDELFWKMHPQAKTFITEGIFNAAWMIMNDTAREEIVLFDHNGVPDEMYGVAIVAHVLSGNDVDISKSDEFQPVFKQLAQEMRAYLLANGKHLQCPWGQIHLRETDDIVLLKKEMGPGTPIEDVTPRRSTFKRGD